MYVRRRFRNEPYPEHARILAGLAKELQITIFVRPVNKDSFAYIKRGNPTKGLDIKAKTALSGGPTACPFAGLIPTNQSLCNRGPSFGTTKKDQERVSKPLVQGACSYEVHKHQGYPLWALEDMRRTRVRFCQLKSEGLYELSGAPIVIPAHQALARRPKDSCLYSSQKAWVDVYFEQVTGQKYRGKMLSLAYPVYLLTKDTRYVTGDYDLLAIASTVPQTTGGFSARLRKTPSGNFPSARSGKVARTTPRNLPKHDRMVNDAPSGYGDLSLLEKYVVDQFNTRAKVQNLMHHGPETRNPGAGEMAGNFPCSIYHWDGRAYHARTEDDGSSFCTDKFAPGDGYRVTVGVLNKLTRMWRQFFDPAELDPQMGQLQVVGKSLMSEVQ